MTAPYTTSFITGWALLQTSGTRKHSKELNLSCNFSPQMPASPHLSKSWVQLKEKLSPVQKSLDHCFRLF